MYHTSQSSNLEMPVNEKAAVNIYYQNMNSIRGSDRQKSLYLSSLELDYDAYAFSETYLDSSVQDSLLFNSCFSVYRCDRNRNNSEKHSGGGVLIAVHRRLVCREFARAENNEAICVRIDTMNGNIFLCCGYIPPTSNVHRYQSFAQFVESIIETVGPHDVVLVFGDFNLPNLKWNQRFQEGNNCFLLPDRITTRSEMAIVDGFLSAGLMQVCDLPK